MITNKNIGMRPTLLISLATEIDVQRPLMSSENIILCDIDGVFLYPKDSNENSPTSVDNLNK